MTKIFARAHTNIALVKYWGKLDETQKLPYNSSLSLTLDHFYTDTAVVFSDQFSTNQFILDDVKQNEKQSQRVLNYVDLLQDLLKVPKRHFQVSSYNHVPISAGLASSSSAFASLAAAVCKALDIQVDLTTLSRLARLGSGSATRSVFGGFVEWQKGDIQHPERSQAISIAATPKMDLQLLVIELDLNPKKISSTSGMKHSVVTSPYFTQWTKTAETDLQLMKKAITRNDFTALGEIAEANALAMHATNHTARPAFTYFTPKTLAAMQLVVQLRHEGIECYFTIDAGPNLKVLTPLRNVKKISERFRRELTNVKIISASFGPGITYKTLN